jgi:hypothetical protein
MIQIAILPASGCRWANFLVQTVKFYNFRQQIPEEVRYGSHEDNKRVLDE